MLKQLGPGIWTAEGPEVVAALGFHYPTRMALVRLPGAGLLAWSPTALTQELRRAVDALGQVDHIVAPNSLHHVFLSEWKAAYPQAKFHAAPGLREKRKDIAFDTELGEASPSGWAGVLDHVVMRGNRITTEVVFFHHESGAVIFTDLLQQFPSGWFAGWRGLVARLDLMTGPEPAVPRKFRAAFTDRAAARASLQRILAWPAQRVLMAHGAPILANAPSFIARAFAWLQRP